MYVSFHKTRGGEFYNPGYVEFVGEMDFQELISFLSDSLYINRRDEKGRFTRPYLTDGNGRVVTDDDLDGHTGTIDFDGDYDTYYSLDADDLGDEEVDAIRRAKGYVPDEIMELVSSYE